MKNNEFAKDIQKKLSSGYKVLDFIHHTKTIVISIEDTNACIEFEKIRKKIKDQLTNIKVMMKNDIGISEEFTLGNIVKATIGEDNTLDISYNLKRTNS